MKEFRTVRELAVYFRDIMDQYSGRTLPDEIKKEFVAYCNDSRYSKKIFKGQEFSKGFEFVMRDYRLEVFRQILHDEGFYNR